MNTSIADHDTDAFDFIATPVWFERHPSQAEGEDF